MLERGTSSVKLFAGLGKNEDVFRPYPSKTDLIVRASFGLRPTLTRKSFRHISTRSEVSMLVVGFNIFGL